MAFERIRLGVIRCIRRHNDAADLSRKTEDLKQYYTPIDLDPQYHSQKKKAVSKMMFILKRTKREILQAGDIQEILQCSLTAVYYFDMHVKITKKSTYRNINRKRAHLAYKMLVNNLLPEFTDLTIQFILNFISAIKLWPFESFVGQILEIVLVTTDGTNLLNHLLQDFLNNLSEFEDARHRIRVFYELLDFTHIDIFPALITRLKDILSITFSLRMHRDVATNLRKGLEVCIRKIFKRIDNAAKLPAILELLIWCSSTVIAEEEFLMLSPLLGNATYSYTVGMYGKSLSNELLTQLLEKMIVSKNNVSSLIGCRVLRCFLDRQRNSSNIAAPTIFYHCSQNYLRVGEYNRCDKEFLSLYRGPLHDSILIAVRKHSNRIPNLKALFILLCCIILEVPCGFTAAAVACMAIAIQEFALNGKSVSDLSKFRLHIIVGSVLSLICWVHKGGPLYDYVNEVIMTRQAEAPHLNPPFIEEDGSQHDSVWIWNKTVLFFDSWKLREGIYCHFRNVERDRIRIRD